MMEKALIRYRLSRKNPGTPTNIMSSLVRALFANGQDGTKRYLIRMNLLWFIINGSYKTIKMRDKGYEGIIPFYEETPDFVRESVVD